MKVSFKPFDFEAMRDWLSSLPCSDRKIPKARTALFDRLRYKEDYSALCDFIIAMGGQIG